jgi:hypothetical protein
VGARVTLSLDHIPESTRVRLQRFANGIAGHYGVPVYLCGSALRPDNPEPRDYDVRVTLPDEDFSDRYGWVKGAKSVDGAVRQWIEEGSTGAWTRLRFGWSDDCVKQARLGRKQVQANVDFQVYPETWATAVYGDKPRVRIDTREG